MTEILAHSLKEFGAMARDRYAALLLQSMRDIASDPLRPGTSLDNAIDPTCRFYHVRHSRARVAKSVGRVKEPRHLLAFEIAADGMVDVLAIVPDPVPRDLAVARLRGRDLPQ